MEISNLLLGILVLPLFGIFFLLLIPEEKLDVLRFFGFSISLLVFLLSLNLWILFDNSSARFQFICNFEWNSYTKISPVFGLDGISLLFILLTTLLIPLCILASWDVVTKNLKEFLIAFLALETGLCFVFSILDILLFYVFFESVLIPMFIIIGIWGSRTRKIRAGYQFFLYTLLGSVLMLIGMLLIIFEVGTTNYQLLLLLSQEGFLFSEERELILWLAFFASFAIKVPMVPFHIWLPEAHVEAPTAGSVILAGILLKLGAYGFLRFSIGLFPQASFYFTPFIFVLSLIAILYTSLTTLRQVDLKKIIAYSSVAHMGFVTLGIFTNNIQGLEGALLIMISHGFVSSALFLCVGVLYDRYHTRLIKFYGGLAQRMPLFTIIFLFFSLANLSFPGTSSFPGELLTLIGAAQTSFFLTFFAAIGMVLGAGYSIWLANRLLFGGVCSSKWVAIALVSDIKRREFALFLPLIFLTGWMGIYPNIFLNVFHLSISNLLHIVPVF